jgi:hypothetical protein
MYFVMPKTPEKETSTEHKPDSKPAANDAIWGGIGMAWHFWLSNVMFALIVWWWLNIQPYSL